MKLDFYTAVFAAVISSASAIQLKVNPSIEKDFSDLPENSKPAFAAQSEAETENQTNANTDVAS